MAIESVRLSVEAMTPVILLSDGYLANGAEPWKLPDISKLPAIEIQHPHDPNLYLPYKRDDKTLARPWAIPGTPGLEHRLGGLEKQDGTGNVSYDPQNHEHMIKTRTEKIQRLSDSIPPLQVFGKEEGDILVVGWGGTYGAITSGVEQMQKDGISISSIHIRYLNPFPKNLEEILRSFDTVIVPELNQGQLASILRSRFLINAKSINKMQGQPFKVQEIIDGIKQLTQKEGVSSWPKQQLTVHS